MENYGCKHVLPDGASQGMDYLCWNLMGAMCIGHITKGSSSRAWILGLARTLIVATKRAKCSADGKKLMKKNLQCDVAVSDSVPVSSSDHVSKLVSCSVSRSRGEEIAQSERVRGKKSLFLKISASLLLQFLRFFCRFRRRRPTDGPTECEAERYITQAHFFCQRRLF